VRASVQCDRTASAEVVTLEQLEIDAIGQVLRQTAQDASAFLHTPQLDLLGRAALCGGHVPQMQQILRRLIVGKLTCTPKLNGDHEFVGRGTVRPLLAGVVRKLASPTGTVR
jgi:hypothetical protein